MLTVGPAPAATGVFSLDRLRLGSLSGPENTIYTAGDVIVPEGGADIGTYYRFVVTDASGAVRNGSSPCTPAGQFGTADNSYTVSASDEPSTATPWKYTLNQYPTSSCTGAAAKTTSKTFYVARATAFADSSLATRRTAFAPGASVYVTVAGLKPSTTNWTLTWITPTGAPACANTAGSDRPETNASGRLPKTSGGYLQYRPSLATGGSPWNRETAYEVRPCPTLGASNEGTWRVRLEKDPTTFVVLDVFAADATAPDTTITEAPSNPSSSATATFMFAATETGARFQCDLDGAGYVDCSSPKTYSAVADGVHAFHVKAIDEAGNADATAATYTWTVDAAAPAVTLLTPAAASSTNDATPVFSGRAGAAPGDASIVTVAVYAGSSPLGTPVQMVSTTRAGDAWSVEAATALVDGTYTAQATQSDSGGNTGLSSANTFTVDTVPPETTITASPPDPSSSPSASFSFTSSEPGSTFRCDLDGAGFVACTSPTTYSVLADGPHSFSVKATDAARNDDPSAATRTWTVMAPADSTPPVVTLTAPANGSSTSDTIPSFAGQAGILDGDSSTVIIKVYGGTGVTGSPLQVLTATRGSGGTYAVDAVSPLALGTYSARAEQSDAAGNLGTSSTNTFTIVSPPPSYRSAILADGPSAYWRFGETAGETAYDEMGLNNGTYSGGVSLGQGGALGDGNPAAAFDGVDDLVTVPSSSSLNATAGITLEAWVKRSKTGAWQNILAKPGDGANANQSYALWLNTTNQVVAIFGNGSTSLGLYSPSIDTNWHHLVATYDNATAKIYIDGVLRASATSTVRLTPNTRQLVIGRSLDNLRIFGGRIDEVAVYSSALSAARVQAHFDRAASPPVGGDTTPPVLALTTPTPGTSTSDTTPTFAGTAGAAAGDSTTVTVKVYSGPSVAGSPVQTVGTTRDASGAFAVEAALLAEGTYTAQAQQEDDAGNVGRSSANTFTVVVLGGDPVLVGAGDIAYCGSSGDEATAALLDQYPSGTVFTLGDNAYESGTAAEFANCYHPSWGRAKARTRPALGDHEYAADADASGYMAYFRDQLAPFGPAASDSSRGWYSYDVGTWHVVVMNTECDLGRNPCTVADQKAWLVSDLAAHPTACTLAILAEPRFSSGAIHGSSTAVEPFWQVLYDNNAELVLSGDDHVYERFAPQTPSGVYDAQRGIRQFVVGTGGRSHYSFANQIVANSEVRDASTFGVMKLVLHPTSYDWEFVPEAGRTFRDSGTQVCH